MAESNSTPQPPEAWERLPLRFPMGEGSRLAFAEFARDLALVAGSSSSLEATRSIDSVVRQGRGRAPTWPKEDVERLRAALLVLADLARQGWAIRVSAEGTVDVLSPQPPIPIGRLGRSRSGSRNWSDETSNSSSPRSRNSSGPWSGDAPSRAGSFPYSR